MIPAPKLLGRLNPDLMLHVESFLDNPGHLSHTNRALRALNNNTLNDRTKFDFNRHYQSFFGEINKTFQSDANTMNRLLFCGERQPDVNKNYNEYRAPTGFFERLKWLAGVDNRQDRTVQDHYNKNIRLLENTQATSIFQLQYQLRAFWHSDRIIKDYAQFKSSEQARVINTRTRKIVFCVLRFFLKCRYNPSSLNIGRNLDTRSRETCAKIGKFTLGGKKYNVAAFHLLADEASEDNPVNCAFVSKTHGKTYIGIFESHQKHSLNVLGHGGKNHNFKISIGREEHHWSGISSEDPRVVYKDKLRHLLVDYDLEYRDETEDAQGSDRLLDQKLTQIMIEMLMQNNDIINLRVMSSRGDLPVLAAGGFEGYEHMQKQLDEFRAIEGNRLFPPYRDYGGSITKFTSETLREKNVMFSRGESESWHDIVRREPILRSNAAILPEYWVTKPNIVEEPPTTAAPKLDTGINSLRK